MLYLVYYANKFKRKLLIVQTTFPNKETAMDVSKIIMNKNLAACFSVKEITSHYKWDGNKVTSQEFMVEFKTHPLLERKIMNELRIMHQYKIPSIVSCIFRTTKDYEAWILSELGIDRRKKLKIVEDASKNEV
jgi:periplasmic divalent cation tolerance protein